MMANKLIDQRCASLTALTFILAISCILFLQKLGNPYITLWDEAIHVNVIKNLAEHCCLPQLHRSASIGMIEDVPTIADFEPSPHARKSAKIGTNYRDWKNNTLWLHKPLLPFYVTAGVYKLLGGSLWALRLPGAIFALLTTVVVYLIAHDFLSDVVGLCGAAIFSLNPYTNQLVHGREFSGFPDLAFAFFVSIALYLILDWRHGRATATLRWLGLVLGLGYMCKGGLALAPFAVLAGIAILTGGIRDLIPALQSIVVFGIVVLPERLYWLAHHPVEFRYEQQQQLLHLFRVIESHGGSWLSYFAGYLPSMLALPLVPFAYFSIGWALTRCRPGTPGYTLSIWTLAYLVPLSFGVSKIENFIFAVLPPIALLIPHVMESLIYSRRFRLLLSLCISSVAMFILSRATRHSEQLNFLTFFAVIAVFVAALAMLFLVKFESKTMTTSALVLTSVALLSLYAHRDILAIRTEPADTSAQLTLRQTGSELQPLVDKNGLILAHNNTVEFAYLYLMYWSGVDVLDICREPQPSKTLEHFREQNNIYLITNDWLPIVPLARLPIGNLYSVRGVPFELWSSVASEACK